MKAPRIRALRMGAGDKLRDMTRSVANLTSKNDLDSAFPGTAAGAADFSERTSAEKGNRNVHGQRTGTENQPSSFFLNCAISEFCGGEETPGNGELKKRTQFLA
jgi:hypothetical protein